jgi:hypothetical protein
VILATGGPLTRVERAALAAGLVVAAALAFPLRGMVTDGTYVWLRYAENLARGHGLVFNPGERVYGCTSPLWVSLIADGIALGFDGLQVARVLGFVATLASVGLFLQLLRRTVRSPLVRAAATVAWSAHPWMTNWACSGLETPLAVALVLAGFVALTEGEAWGDRPVRTGALWALAAMTRPGGVLLCVLWVTALIADAENRPAIRRLVYGVAPVLLIYGSWLLFARVYYGTFWPQTLAIAVDQRTGWGPSLVHLGGQVRLALGAHGVLAAAFAVAVLAGGRRMWPARRGALHYLPWMWVIGLPALFAARIAPIESRQLALVAPIATWLAWRAVEAWWSGQRPTPHVSLRGAFLGGALAALLFAQEIGYYRDRVLPEVREGTRALNSGLVQWGRWLRANAPARSSVATPLVGTIGHLSGLRVVDLTGLVSPEILALRETNPDVIVDLSFGSVSRPGWLVDTRPAADLLSRTRFRGALEVVAEAEGNTLYRIDWARADSLRVLH